MSRRMLALRPEALTAQGRIFVEEIARWQTQQAKEQGIEGGEPCFAARERCVGV